MKSSTVPAGGKSKPGSENENTKERPVASSVATAGPASTVGATFATSTAKVSEPHPPSSSHTVTVTVYTPLSA